MIRAALGVVRDLAVGDDPALALALAAGLGVCAALAAAGLGGWWAVPVVVLAGTLASLRRAVRRGG